MDKTAPSSISSASEFQSESSKTDSSNPSQHTTAQDKEHNVEDSGLTPIDMECHIQAERITKSLDKLVYQAKLALCIPTLLHDPILSDTLTEQHLADIRSICNQYNNPLFSSSLMNMAAVEDIQAGDMSIKNRLNPELGFMLYTLCSYPQLKHRVEMITEEIKNKFAQHGSKVKAPPPGLLCLLKIVEFRNLMIAQITNTAAEELALKIRTRKLEASNQEEVAKISVYSKYLREETEYFENDMIKKAEIIAQLKQELADFQHKDLVKRKKQILDSERQMVLMTRAHNVKQQMLKEEEVETRENYDITLRNHMLTEKNLRLRRTKVETQLQSWLQKYDGEMSVKQEELDDLTKQYDDEVELKEGLEKKMVDQELEYIPLMAEREAEYHAEMEEKFKLFLVEHAARVIQVAWRDTLRNRAEKKKLKRLQAKQIAEREAAARKAEIEARKAAAEEKKREKEAKKAEKEAAKQAKLDAAAAKAAGNEAKPEEAD